MMAARTLRLLLAGLLMMNTCNYRVDAVKPFYRHFDEYLNSLAHKRPDIDGGRDGDVLKHRNVVTRGTSTAANRRNMSCCMLGEMAGDKGFHCFVDYYAARIVMRNRNRAHNRKMGFYGRYRSPNYGHHLMKTFERCVQGHGNIFHKCCHLATLERRDARYRVHTVNSVKANGSNDTVNTNVTHNTNMTMIDDEMAENEDNDDDQLHGLI